MNLEHLVISVVQERFLLDLSKKDLALVRSVLIGYLNVLMLRIGIDF